MLSCSAPTYASSREEKEAFFDSLQQAISAVPPGESYVMLGNFNARVGSRLLSEPLRLLPVTLPVTRQGTSKGHQEVNNKKENKEMNKKDDNNKAN